MDHIYIQIRMDPQVALCKRRIRGERPFKQGGKACVLNIKLYTHCQSVRRKRQDLKHFDIIIVSNQPQIKIRGYRLNPSYWQKERGQGTSDNAWIGNCDGLFPFRLRPMEYNGEGFDNRKVETRNSLLYLRSSRIILLLPLKEGRAAHGWQNRRSGPLAGHRGDVQWRQ